MIRLNDTNIIPTLFPDGTSQVWKLPLTDLLGFDEYLITWEFENDAEIFQLIQLRQLLCHTLGNKPVSLYMPFLPYGRQDKDISNEDTFALRSLALIVNEMDFEEVVTIDAHSKVFEELFNNAVNQYPHHQIEYAINSIFPDVIAYPDTGAVKRYRVKRMPTVVGVKKRDPSTGRILRYNVDNLGIDLKGKKVLMVDDLCDGGGTFILMTKRLYELGAKSVHLYVTHALLTKGMGPLLQAGIVSIFDKYGEVHEYRRRKSIRCTTREESRRASSWM